jgi:hypothetical protein
LRLHRQNRHYRNPNILNPCTKHFKVNRTCKTFARHKISYRFATKTSEGFSGIFEKNIGRFRIKISIKVQRFGIACERFAGYIEPRHVMNLKYALVVEIERFTFGFRYRVQELFNQFRQHQVFTYLFKCSLKYISDHGRTLRFNRVRVWMFSNILVFCYDACSSSVFGSFVSL